MLVDVTWMRTDGEIGQLKTTAVVRGHLEATSQSALADDAEVESVLSVF